MLNSLYANYKSKADFKIVYVREAHPSDGWQVSANERQGVIVATPKTLEEREKAATQCSAHLELKIPILIDNMDDKVEAAYSGWPDRIYIVGSDGKVSYKGARGPAGFHPQEAEAYLKSL